MNQAFVFRHLSTLLQIKEPRLHILIYHRVMPRPDPLRPGEIDQKLFANQMRWISSVFRVIPLSQAIEELSDNRLKRRSLSITFDDGYLDNATHALPVLQSFGFNATFFCTSAWLSGGLMWNDQVIESVRYWPRNTIRSTDLKIGDLPVKTIEEKKHAIQTILAKLKYMPHDKRSSLAEQFYETARPNLEIMMRPEHIKQLHNAGMGIGGHTHSHPIMARLDETAILNEITINKSTIENILDEKIHTFAYPNGKLGSDFKLEHKEIISSSGYKCALTTEPNVASKRNDLYELPRFTPWDKNQFKYLARMTARTIV